MPEQTTTMAASPATPVTLSMTLALKRSLEKLKYHSMPSQVEDRVAYLGARSWETPEYLAKKDELVQLEFQRLRARSSPEKYSDKVLMQSAREFARV